MCFNDYGGNGACYWTIMELVKDGLTLQRRHRDEEKPKTGATLLSERTSKALKCNWEQYLTHQGNRTLNIKASVLHCGFKLLLQKENAWT